jgi:hypothetical protein
MTDPSRDDLASAVLDGLLGDEEAAAALRDPAVARRVEEMRAVRSLLQPAPPLDAARRERSIAAALAAADTARTPGGPRTPEEPHTPAAAGAPAGRPYGPGFDSSDERPAAPGGLDERRRRGARRAHAARWLPAAAVILVVLAVAGLVAVAGSSSDSDMAADTASEGGESNDTGSEEATAESSEASGDEQDATSAPEASDGQDDADASGGTMQESTESGAAADSAAPGAARSLGAFTTADDLAAAADATAGPHAGAALGQDVTADEAEARLETFAAEAGCESPAAGRAGDGPIPVLLGNATLAGAPVTVWVLDDADGRRIVVLDAACAVVDDRVLPTG